MTENNPLPPTSDPVAPTAAPVVVEPVVSAAPTGPGLVDVAKAGWAATGPFDQKLIIAGVAAAAVMLLSTFMTWVHAFVVSVSGTSTGTGKFVLLAALATIVVVGAVLARKLPGPITWLATAGTYVGITVLVLVLMIRMHHAFSGMGDLGDNPVAGMMTGSFGLGIGIYLTLLSALAGAAAFATLSTPSLAKFQLPTNPKPLGIALGIGAAAGLIIGFIG